VATGAGHSGLAGGLRIGTSLLDGATSTMDAINTFRGMASSGKKSPRAD